MLVPLSWIKDFVDIDDIPIEELAHTITMAGLEVEEIKYVGLPMPGGKVEGVSAGHQREETKRTGISWDREKIVVGAILEVMPHPNADRLVLCRLDDGQQEHTILTGAPNLFEYKGKGTLERPLKVCYAMEGAQIFDGYSDEQKIIKLKRAKIRGVESYSMVCSEKELGISDEHEGIIILEDEAPVGMPLADYMGDVVFDISITPNIARNANVLGVAREIAALYDRALKSPSLDMQAEGDSIDGKVSIEIIDPVLNPRFVLGLIENITIKPSPRKIQRRLKLAGMRPINNIVDATNYTMLELGEPLHAFDYDFLVKRVGGKTPKIITRAAEQGETLTTLDGEERTLHDFTVLVCDTEGPLALAGVMGGEESEVSENTSNVLLEGAIWNYVNVRQTQAAQRLQSEAAYRFARGVHPEMAPRGVRRGLELMRQWSGGTVCKGLVDNYPKRNADVSVEVSPRDARRLLGLNLTSQELADILRRLQFNVQVEGEVVHVTTPDHRLDISEGVVGRADLMEEVARVYGYENIPETRLQDTLPPQRGNPTLEVEEEVRDILVSLGLQEIISYRLTSEEKEMRRLPLDSPPDDKPYIKLANPLSPERAKMRKSLVASVLDIMESNARVSERLTFFEIAPIFLASEEGVLPDELNRLVICITGPRELSTWLEGDQKPLGFYDLKGVLEGLFDGLRISGVHYEPGKNPMFHPGKCGRVIVEEKHLGVFGELHPQVAEQYKFGPLPVMVADIDMDALFDLVPPLFESEEVPIYPPVLEDLAVVVDEFVAAEDIELLIAQTGGKAVAAVRLFDVYRGEQVGRSKKSLAYSITYQAEDRTLTDKEVSKLRNKIVKRLEREFGAKLRA
jgi:phenylalanyl-tRNA synthetase beta chain